MTAVAPQPIATRPFGTREAVKGSFLLRMFRTTDHKQIGIMYLVTSFAFFMVGGAMAMLMRTELARPGMQFLSQEQFNQLFTMHGTVMLLLYATPILFGFANFILPLQIGSPDVAFPRLNAFSYWLYLFGGLTMAGMRVVVVATARSCSRSSALKSGSRRMESASSVSIGTRANSSHIAAPSAGVARRRVTAPASTPATTGTWRRRSSGAG